MQIHSMFRSLFSSNNYCMDVVTGTPYNCLILSCFVLQFISLLRYLTPIKSHIAGMNEVYVTGPSRKSEGANSDNIFYTRHVDGPWGLIPFVSVYRCIVGMDRNMMVTILCPPGFSLISI